MHRPRLIAVATLAAVLIACDGETGVDGSAGAAGGMAAGTGASGVGSSGAGASGGGSTGGAGGGVPAMTFRNAINMGPDPFMAYHDGSYYLATTQGDAVRMWKAPTVGQLLTAEPITVWQDPDPTHNQQVWAPSFHFIGGHWYVYYTGSDGIDDNHRIYVAESEGTDPLGPYHYKGRLAAPGAEEVWAIDQEILQQDSGLYLMWSGKSGPTYNLLFIAPLSDPWTVSGARVQLPAAGGCPEVREGPSILQRDGTTFMIYSTCDTGKPDYQLWMKSIPTSADPMIPDNWIQHPDPVLVRNDAEGVFGPGHNGFFKSPDGTEDWIVYHAKNTSQYTYEGRTTRIGKVSWNGGVPSFGAPPASGATLDVPSGDPGGGPYWINDNGDTSGLGGVTYQGAWTHYPRCGNQCFFGDDHGATEPGATATFTFTGTQIALLSVRDAGNGVAAFSIDGEPETFGDFYMGIRHGELVNYVSPHLEFGEHTLVVRVTGDKNAASSGVAISIDRAEVYTD
ncbi:MAG: family 43 glycosylhydrolase [Polyangiaceae bacterium]|nr:family 43 glycosylhydrolase [Polyangiaceae bacterium]